ncbi:MDR family MFS transporter [Microvirga massiliensis]|uniref:MDR family MFS transporter n=1 Tax=Microvirga massiliensis TaxID=1033741 RepID=UPI00062B90C3|nr:MDR family MFS transporter [Microvirga massiliensis]
MDQSTGEALRGAKMSPKDIRVVLVGTLLAMFLAALDQTIIATALPTIGRELGDAEHLTWIATVYLLTATAVTPLYGKFSDSHGRRITLLVAIVIFILGSVACALAPGMIALIVARAVQGLGGGGLIALGQTIAADMMTPRERARYQVYFASMFMTASLLGPVLGGFFAEHFHWSLIFWINLPLGVLAFVISANALRRLPRFERPHRPDLLGAVLLVAATVASLLLLSWGGTRFPWLSMPMGGLFLLALALWWLFSFRLGRAAEPLIPPGVLHNPVVRMGTLAACFGMGTYIGLTIFLPVYFETVRGLSATDSGLALLPLMGGTVVGATLSGRVLIHVRHYKRLPLAGLLMASVAIAILALEIRSLAMPFVEILLALVSIGLGTLLPVSTLSIQNAVAPHELGTATAVANFFRSLGGALIVAVFGAILLGATGLGGEGMLTENLASSAARNGVDLANAFRLVFAAASLGFLAAWSFLWRMEERPLTGRAPPATSHGE